MLQNDLLRTVGLVAEWGGLRRLDHLDLMLAGGESVGLIGVGGAGKRTLSALLTGVRAPDGGVILLDEQPAPPEALRKAGAFISGSSRLLPALSLTENLFLARPLGAPLFRAQHLRTLAGELLSQLDLAVWLDVPTHKIPPTEQQQLLLLRAALGGKRFAILAGGSDTPAQEQQALLHTIHAMNGRGLSILYTADRMDDIASCLPRCSVLSHGRIVKVLHRSEYPPAAAHAYLYGYQAQRQKAPAPVSAAGATLLTMDGVSIRGGTARIIRNEDDTTAALLHRIADACAQAGVSRPAIFGTDSMNEGWIRGINVLDNLLLSAAPHIANRLGHISTRMKSVIRRECLTQTGLREEVFALLPNQVTRAARLRLSLYRWRLRGARIFVFNFAQLDKNDRIALDEAQSALLAQACAVLRIEAASTSPSELVWQNGILQEDSPCIPSTTDGAQI